jgi:2-polyprenyl-3-methyl-5-hydroxy-6-metoxy-1,4-benzoquinol methylase
MTSELKENFLPCHLCNSSVLLIDQFEKLQLITSDCKPWKSGSHLVVCKKCNLVQKQTTQSWYEDINKIYQNYDIYLQGEGQEQPIFNQRTGSYSARSEIISSWLRQNLDLAEKGDLLDVGCGLGVFMKAFGREFGDWSLSGYEYDDKNLDLIKSLKNVNNFYTGKLLDIKNKFNFISFIHSLEHIPNPVETLKEVKLLLKDDGYLLIEVPNVEASPFDILIVDHCSHFSLATLTLCLELAGFEIVKAEVDLAPKELTVVAKISEKSKSCLFNEIEKSKSNYFDLQIEWLNSLVEQAKEIKSNVGIFGTSISATWLKSTLGDKISFFVDEDKNRAGRSHMDIPIISIGELNKESTVLMPLRFDIAKMIKERLKIANLLLPPELKAK